MRLLAVLVLLCTVLHTHSRRKGAVVVVLRDAGLDDVTESFLQSRLDSFQSLVQVLPHQAKDFRSASPDHVPTYASILTGKFPSELGIFRSEYAKQQTFMQQAPLSTNLFGQVNQKVHVAHFGVWPFQEDLSAHVNFSFVNEEDFSMIIARAKDYIQNSIPEDQDFLVNLWLPRLDATMDVGGVFTEDNWHADIQGVRLRSAGTECPDVFRGDNSDYVARYKTCPKQIYRANRAHELDIVADFLELVSLQSGSILSLLTSTNGQESEFADSHSESTHRFRGEKRTLYDGGLRIPFRYSWTGTSGRSSPGTSVNELSLSTVDIAPTLLEFFDIASTTIQQDGVSFCGCLEGSPDTMTCDFKRQKPLMWEWRYASLGHCMNESPRFSILMGDYKLLLEPARGQTGTERIELYDLTLGSFEKLDLASAALSDAGEQARLERISNTMKQQLQNWIDYLESLGRYFNHPEDTDIVQHFSCLDSVGTMLEEGKAVDGQKLVTAERNNRAATKNVTGIIFVLADDMGFGDVSALERKTATETLGGLRTGFATHTPHLDKAIRDGIVMNHFYSNSCVCSPSRAAFSTGRLPSHKDVRFHNALSKKAFLNDRNGVADFLGKGVDYKKDLTTLTRFLHDNGFVTAHFGKWHLGYDYSNDQEYDVDGAFYGLDEYQVYGYLEGSGPAFKWEKTVQFPTASKPHKNSLDNKDLLFASYVQETLVNRTIDFLQDRASDKRRFFVNIWLQNPHAPLNLATSFDQPAANGLPSSENPFPFSTDSKVLKSNVDSVVPLQIYQTLLRDQERQIGRLFEALEDLNLAEDTLVVYAADNGPEDRSLYFAAKGSPSIFRGAKRSLYEGGIRTPMFAVWKNQLDGNGRVIPAPSSLVDLFPTFATLAGLKAQYNQLPDVDMIQGRDLSCLWLGTCSSASFEDRSLFFEYRDEFIGDCLGVSPRFAIRKGRYKLLWEQKDTSIVFPTKSDEDGRMELYDLINDPLELNNLLLTRPGDPTITNMADSLRADILEQYVGASWYDTKTTPKPAWFSSLKRYDRTAADFYLLESCDLAAGPAQVTSVAVSATAELRVNCSITSLCDGSTPQTAYPTASLPTMTPTAMPTRSPSASPSLASSPSSSPSSSDETLAPSSSKSTSAPHTGATKFPSVSPDSGTTTGPTSPKPSGTTSVRVASLFFLSVISFTADLLCTS